MKRIVLSLLFLSLIACEKTISYDLPTEEPQLAVTTRIFAMDSVASIVSITSPVLNNKTQISSTATVILYEDGVMVSQLTPINTGGSVDGVPLYVYVSSYDCIPGRTYTIRASQSGYETVEGTVTIPPNAPELSDPVRTKRGQFDDISVTLKDEPGEENYYRIEMVRNNNSPVDPSYSEGFYTNDLTIEFYDGYSDFIEIDGEGNYGSKGYLRDRFFDGKSKKIEISQWSSFGAPSNQYLKISAITKESYDFERTIDLALYSDAGPFSEPVSIISNMSNGKGGIAVEHSSQILIP